MVLRRLKKLTGMEKKTAKPEDLPDWVKDKVEKATGTRPGEEPPSPSASAPSSAPSAPPIDATAQAEASAPSATEAVADAPAEEAPPVEAVVAEPEAPEAEPAAPAPVIYTVVSGDTLSGIAQRFYGDASAYMRIFEANRDKLNDPNLIHPGQDLVIPQ